MTPSFRNAAEIFRRNGGTMRMSEAVRAGVSRKTLYAMRDQGVLEQLARGLYRLTSLPSLAEPDLITVATRIPSGVVCTISALAFHELTTQVPHAVDVAIARGSETPRLEYPPINLYWFSGQAFTSGIETHTLDGKVVRIYSAEKTIADVFKYRNKLGTDLALEALQNWRRRRTSKPARLLEYAKICRVERIVRPYLEALS